MSQSPIKIPSKEQLQTFMRYPYAWMMFMAFGMMGFFINKTFSGGDQQLKEMQRQILMCELKLARVERRADSIEATKYELVNELMIKSGILDRVKKNTDSLTRKAVGNKAKAIVEKSQR